MTNVTMDKTVGLKKYAEEKGKIALEKVEKAIRTLSLKGINLNFNSIAEESGVSKSFLYNNDEIRQRIEILRQQEINKDMNQRIKASKTDRTKDIIIMAKDKKIRELEELVKKQKRELEILRGKLYNNI